MTPKAHISIECPYCGVNQVHSQAFKPEAHQCATCERTFVLIPRVEVKRVEGEIAKPILRVVAA